MGVAVVAMGSLMDSGIGEIKFLNSCLSLRNLKYIKHKLTANTPTANKIMASVDIYSYIFEHKKYKSIPSLFV